MNKKLLFGILIISLIILIPSVEAQEESSWWEDVWDWFINILGFSEEEAEEIISILTDAEKNYQKNQWLIIDNTTIKDAIIINNPYGSRTIYEDGRIVVSMGGSVLSPVGNVKRGSKVIPTREAKELNESDGLNINIDLDKDYPLEVDKVNFVDDKLTIHLKDIGITSKDLNVDIPLRVISKDEEGKDIITFSENQNFNSINEKEQLSIPINVGDILKYGEHSTTINISSNASAYGFADAYTAESAPTKNWGGATTLTLSGVAKRLYWFNTTYHLGKKKSIDEFHFWDYVIQNPDVFAIYSLNEYFYENVGENNVENVSYDNANNSDVGDFLGGNRSVGSLIYRETSAGNVSNYTDYNLTNISEIRLVDDRLGGVSFTMQCGDGACNMDSHSREGDNPPYFTVTYHDANNPPTNPTIVLNSSDASQTNYTDEDLTCNFLCNDEDVGDTLTYDISWYVNGIGNQSYTSVSCSNPEYVTETLKSANTTIGDEWACAVNITDDTSESTSTIFSSNLTIRTAITTPTIMINSTDSAQQNYTNETLNCNFNCETSLSGDSFNYSLDFLENGTRVVYSERNINCSTDIYAIGLTSGNTTIRYDYSCRVNITSNLEKYTLPHTYSNNLTITTVNRAPSNLQVVHPSPDNETETVSNSQTYNCTATDADNDTIYYEYYLDANNPPTTLIANETTATTNTTVDGTYWWRCRAVDIYTGQSPYSSPRYLIIDNSTIKNISYYRPTPVYETSAYQYEVNLTINKLTSKSATAILTHNDIGYTPTRTTLVDNDDIAVYRWRQTLSTPIGTSTDIIWNFTITLNNDSTILESSSLTQTIYPILFDFCNSTLKTVYVNYTFKDERYNTLMNASIPDSTFVYSLDSNKALNKTLSFIETGENDSYAFCFDPINRSVFLNIDIDYENSPESYPQRNFVNTTGVYSNVTTNHILYLLGTTDGIYSTFQTITPANQVIDGVYVTVERLISGVYNWIESATTDAAGTVTFFVNPNYLYRFTFSKSGYDTQVLSINPTQSSYTVTMGTEAEVNVSSYNLGITYDINPAKDILDNETDYDFSFNISSTFWSLTSSGFVLTNGSGTHLGADSCTTSTGCVSSATVNTQNHTSIVMKYYWEILEDGNYYFMNGTKSWRIYKTGTRKSVVDMFKSDITKLGHGFGDFTKAMISFFIILFAVGIMSYYSGIYSPLAILGEIFFLVFLLDQINFIPEIVDAVPHFITILIGILFLSYGIYEYTKGGA